MDILKRICIDKVSARLLRSLKSERQKMGISQEELGRLIGSTRTVISIYETGRKLPTVVNFVKLAEFFGYDLSASVNYKYYHGQIDWYKLRQQRVYYGFTYRELGSYIDWTEGAVGMVFLRDPYFSLDCLSKILEIFEDERRLLEFRNELLRRKTPSRREWWKRTKSPARPNSGSREIWQWPF